jgi:uncharacterized RDD family membrane protein YckC
MSNLDQYTLETPENIEVRFDVAGLGTRFCALLFDYIIMGLIVLALFLLALFLEIALPSPVRFKGADLWILAILAGIALTMMLGYFLFFEWLMRGQTPGKRSLKIRVIRDDGTPVTIHEVFVRNLVRLVDFLPGCYAVGVLFMFPSRLSKRLGDIAAGTIVIKEEQLDYSARADKKRVLRVEPLEHINAELTPAERRLISGFLQRRSELLPEARAALAGRLAFPLYEKYRGEFINAEDYLVRLAEGKQHETDGRVGGAADLLVRLAEGKQHETDGRVGGAADLLVRLAEGKQHEA